MKRVNKEGPALLGGFHAPPRQAPDQLSALLATNALVVDTRPADHYAARHLRGTINIPFNSSFVTWAGWLVPATADLYLLVDQATTVRLEEAVRGLALIGIDAVKGYFETPAIDAAAAQGATITAIPQLTPEALSRSMAARDVSVIDVRGANEWAGGHLPTSTHIPLGHLADRVRDIPTGKPIVVHCQSGARSAIAASLLERLGVTGVINLTGGYAAWTAAGLPVEGGAHESQAARS